MYNVGYTLTMVKHSPKVSIITPVYNCEKYLQRCLDSILTQDYADIEIIALDDGSTDTSRQILEKSHDKTLGLL